MRLKRRNFAWLTALGAAVAVAILAGTTPIVSAALLGIYGLAAVATLIDFKPERLLDRSRSSLTTMRMSSEAREAVERARRRGAYNDDGPTLLDIGLITAQSNREGMVMRRTRSVSLDDDGVRPFITLHVQSQQADQTARIRFEIIDGGGATQYVHEMRAYLRDGEMNILADHQLPLAENAALQSGDWDLRVLLDGKLIGAHMFTLAPSLNDRFRRVGTGANAAPQQSSTPATRHEGDRLALNDTPSSDEPLSLEELLRSRSNRNN
jgi:hypothetical protein